MRDYRWFFHNNAHQIIAADTGRFLTDSDAIEWAAVLLNERPGAASVEIWDQARLVASRGRAAT